mgnify:CR=1 FL=1
MHITFSQLYTLDSRLSPVSLYLLWLKPHDHGYSLTCSHKTCDCTNYHELNVNQKYHILWFNLWVYAYINTFVVIVNAKIKYRTYVFIVYHWLEGVHPQRICATKWTKCVYSWMSTSNYYWVLVHWFTCFVLAFFFKSNHFPPHQSFHKRKHGLSIVVYKETSSLRKTMHRYTYYSMYPSYICLVMSLVGGWVGVGVGVPKRY